MNSVWQDIRYGLGMLGKNAGFTAPAVITVALDISATALFLVGRGSTRVIPWWRCAMTDGNYSRALDVPQTTRNCGIWIGCVPSELT